MYLVSQPKDPRLVGDALWKTTIVEQMIVFVARIVIMMVLMNEILVMRIILKWCLQMETAIGR